MQVQHLLNICEFSLTLFCLSCTFYVVAAVVVLFVGCLSSILLVIYTLWSMRFGLVQEFGYCYHYEVGQHDANAWFWQITTSAHNNVFLLEKRIVDDMNNAIGALYVRPVDIDLLIVPQNHITWNLRKDSVIWVMAKCLRWHDNGQFDGCGGFVRWIDKRQHSPVHSWLAYSSCRSLIHLIWFWIDFSFGFGLSWI